MLEFIFKLIVAVHSYSVPANTPSACVKLIEVRLVTDPEEIDKEILRLEKQDLE